jgi:hypothetical protein
MTLKIKIGKKSFVKLGMYGLAALTLLIASYFLIFYVFPAFALFDQTLTSTSVSVSKSFLGQDTNFNNVWFKNGTAAWVNFTISLNASANITAINITIPGSGNTANFTVENATAGFTPVINASETWVIDYPENYSTDTRAKVVRFNVTDWGRGLKYPNSTKISLYVTPILTSNADLDKNTWSVAIWNASVDGGGATISNSTSLNTWIDSRRPVLINTTPLNATSIKGTATQSFQVYASDYNLNTSNTSLYWRLCANYPTGCGDSYRVALTCLDWGADNDNRTYICSNTVDLSMAQPGRTIAYYFEASDNTTNLGVNGTTSDSLQTIIDQASPLWSANDTSPDSGAEYSSGKDYSFEIAWTDALSSVGGVIFEHNFTTGTLVNKTVSKSGNAYYVNFTGSEFKKAGNYTFRWYANDSVLPEADANWNTSDSWAFNLAKNTTNPLAIYMNGTADSNLTVRYPALVNATVNASYASSGTPSIFRNGTDVTAEVETNVKLPFGDYLYLFNISGNVNYSSNATGATYYAFVERGDTTINLYLNDTLNTDLTIAKGKTVNITLSSTNAEGTLFLYVNGTLHNQTTGVSTVENLTALTGVPGTTWNVTGYSSQSQNYSAAAQIEHYIIVESTPPHYIDNNTFNKSIGSYFGKYEGPLIINAQWKDGFELQNYWLSVQNGTSCGTGNWCNDTASTFDTAANLTNVTINPSTINIANGNVILNASIYANDTSGNVNHTDIYYWIIDGAAPVMRNITPINSAYINGSSNQLFQVYVSDYTLNMSNASLYWKSCAPYPTVCGGWSSRVALTCYKYDSTGNAAPNFICNSTVNLGGQNIGDTIAYYFEASDNSTIYGNNATSSSPNLAYIDDRVAPSYKNNATNTTVIGKFDAVYISANWTDATLDSWTVETDEGGVGQNFKNKTPSAFNSGTWSNYTWSNSTVAVGTTVRLRIYANDTTGKENVTTNMTFQIENTVPWAAVTDTNTTNASTIAKGAILNISANWTDNLGFISGPYTGYWWVQTNSSTDGSTYALANTSAAPFTANNQTNVSYNINTVTYARGSTVTARIFANDTSGNLNYTDLWLWTIDGTVPWAAVTDTNTTNGSTIVKGTVINITANWTDNLGFIGGAMPGFWWIWTNVSTTTDVYAASNSTAVAFTANNQTNVSYNINTVTYARGSIVTAIIYANDTSGNENSTDPWYWTIDGTAPIPINESVEPASETSYAPGKSYVFNVSVSDNINVSVVTLDWNGTANYTATLVNSSGVTARAFNYSVTITDLPRSNNTYRWVANDTSGNWNSTATYNYNVTANATNPVDIYINDTLNLNDTSVTYNTTINATVAAAYSLSGSTYIYRSESDVSSTENATNITLAVGT